MVTPRGYKDFKKLDFTRLVNKDKRNSKEQYFSYPLHTWCDAFEKLKNESVKAYAFEKKAAGQKIVNNATFCLTNSLSLKDFV